jgi:eukaryotic-like serine/threonine-protein kinase
MLDQTISHYRITAKLGAGGMGIVYKALDIKLERTIALKFLPEGVAVSDEDKQNLLREARAASALDHPNIGVIHGLEESEDGQHDEFSYSVLGFNDLDKAATNGPIRN